VILTIEVSDPRGLSLREVQEAINGDETATLEMPGFGGSAPEVTILSVEGDA
jgi:hypothetical protein